MVRAELDPLEEAGAKAAAEPARRVAIASFMVMIKTRYSVSGNVSLMIER
jgi:hypothetical protein